MKKFKATIKATTDEGMSLNYECTQPVGLLQEAITLAYVSGVSHETIARMFSEQAEIFKAK